MEVTTMLWACLVLAALVLLTILAFVAHLGLFSDVDVRTGAPPFKQLTICYKFNRGPYKGCGHLFTEIYSIAPELKCIGLYYDDPEEVVSYELRYAVGAILSDGVRAEPAGVRERVLKHGFKVATFPAIEHAILASFPFKATFSIVLAIWKVYPAIREYMKKLGLCAWPMIEIYLSDEIQFVGPLSRQEDFLVEEATEEPLEQPASESDRPDDDDDEGELAGEAGLISGASNGDQPTGTSSASSFEDLTHASAAAADVQ